MLNLLDTTEQSQLTVFNWQGGKNKKLDLLSFLFLSVRGKKKRWEEYSVSLMKWSPAVIQDLFELLRIYWGGLMRTLCPLAFRWEVGGRGLGLYFYDGLVLGTWGRKGVDTHSLLHIPRLCFAKPQKREPAMPPHLPHVLSTTCRVKVVLKYNFSIKVKGWL